MLEKLNCDTHSLRSTLRVNSVIIYIILRDEFPLNNESIKIFIANVVWMHIVLFMVVFYPLISITVLLSVVPSISIWSTFCAWFICTTHCCHHKLPSLLMFISASPSCESVGVILYDGRLRREVTVDKIERHCPIIINKRKRRERHFQNVILEIFSWPQTII